MRRRHAGKRLERLLQLAQGNTGHVGQRHQIERFFGAIRRPLTDPAHDLACFTSPPQRTAVQPLAGAVEDEQAIFKQLLCQRLALQRAIGFAQAGQGGAQPTAEQRVLATAQRHHEQPFKALWIEAMASQERLVEHHRHFFVVFRGDPDIAALLVEQVKAVFTAVEAERQRPAWGAEELLDTGIQTFFIHLHAIEPQATQFTAEMPRRHLPVLLLPAGGGTHLFSDIGGVESLDLQGIERCHALSCMHSFGALIAE
ncbi:hypothetical protein D3C81_1414360 [compost metagenome]